MLFAAKVDVLCTCIALLDHINHFLSDSAFQSFFNVKITLKSVVTNVFNTMLVKPTKTNLEPNRTILFNGILGT